MGNISSPGEAQEMFFNGTFSFKGFETFCLRFFFDTSVVLSVKEKDNTCMYSIHYFFFNNLSLLAKADCLKHLLKTYSIEHL